MTEAPRRNAYPRAALPRGWAADQTGKFSKETAGRAPARVRPAVDSRPIPACQYPLGTTIVAPLSLFFHGPFQSGKFFP